jgi:hypothetical protein
MAHHVPAPPPPPAPPIAPGVPTCSAGYAACTSPAAPPPPGGTLPFTGFDVWTWIVVGLIILAAGATIAWVSRWGRS